jgi:hypothetical protein
MKKLLLILLCSPLISISQSLIKVDSIKINQSQIWSGVSFDSGNIRITTMMPGNTSGNHIFLIDFDTSLNQIGNPIQLTFDIDIPAGKSITDHKHIFVNNELYVTFSLTQDEDLYLFKTDNYGNRIGNMVTVVSAHSDPTNDMIFFLSDSLLHILFFRPISQHNVYTYDLNLNFLQNQLTSSVLPHNNIGDAIYKPPFYYMFTGNEFGHNSNLTLTKWNTDWSPAISHPQSILPSMNGDGNWFSTGIVYDGVNNFWIVAFQHIDQTTSINNEHIDIVIFDDNFYELYRAHLTSDQCFRPDLLLLDGYLFLTYDKSGGGVFIQKYLFQSNPSVLSEKNEKSNKPRLIRDMLGKSTSDRLNIPLFYIYDDGRVEKRITIE